MAVGILSLAPASFSEREPQPLREHAGDADLHIDNLFPDFHRSSPPLGMVECVVYESYNKTSQLYVRGGGMFSDVSLNGGLLAAAVQSFERIGT